MKFSIVVPVYNAENTLERCVESILNQQIKSDIEIILVEDYSQDDSLNVCYTFSDKYENVKVLRTNGKGVSAARNTGLSALSGDIIGFCDSDDAYEDGVLAKIEKQFEINNNMDFVIGGFFHSRLKNQKVCVEEAHSYTNDFEVEKNKLCNLLINDGRVLGSVCNKFYRSSYIDKIRFQTDIAYCEDLYFNIELLNARNKVCCLILGQPIYHYIHNNCSATNSIDKLFDSENELKYIVALKRLYENVDESYKKMIGYKIVTLAVDFLYHHDVSDDRGRKLINNIYLYSNEFAEMLFVNYKCGSWKWVIKKFVVLLKINIRRKKDVKN